MRIVVCVKAVPDTAARIKVHKDGTKIDPDGVKFTLGPYDARAVAKALQLRDTLFVTVTRPDGLLVRAGLATGDRVTKLAGVPVFGVQGLRTSVDAAVEEARKGGAAATCSLSLMIRGPGGEERTVTLEVPLKPGTMDDEAMLGGRLEPRSDHEVVAASTGAASGEAEAKKRIKDALALGANRGVYVPDPAPENRDPLATAKALAAAVRSLGTVDLVLCGRQAVDDQALAVGPMLGTLLGFPCVTDVVALDIDGGKATARRAADGRLETIEVTLPAVVTCQRDLADEMYPKLKEILAAAKKKIDTVDFAWPAPTYQVVGLAPPPAPAAGKIVGKGPDAVPQLFELLQNEAKVLSF